jgi:DASH complex subunit SPC19
MYWITSGYWVIAPSLIVPHLRPSLFQVFLLVDEGTVKKYKADLSDEIEPQITELVSRAEKGLEALQKKRLLLQTKVSPLSSRTTVRSVLSVWNQVKAAQSKAQQPSTSDATNRRVQVLAKQRERLEEQARKLEAEILAMASLDLP